MTTYQDQASDMLAKSTSLKTVSESQKLVEECRGILKKIAADQKFVGEIRKQLSDKTVALRKVNPKGKPDEGTIKQIKGTTYIFIDDTWYNHEPKKANGSAE